jgi:UDP-glucose 4-epimerase
VTTTVRADAPLVVVTGGAGFIGSHTVDALVEGGCRVVVLDDFSTGKRSNLARWDGDDRVEVIAANVADGLFAPLAGVTRRLGPVARIIHLAAQTAVIRSIESPLDDVRINYVGTVQVLEYARHTGVEKVVFSSSAAVYGDDAGVPTAEDAPCAPLSPYGIDKLGSERFLHYYSAIHGVRTTALRFFNVYGPRQDPASPYSGVISIFADRAMAGVPLTIFGDGQQTRDFVYVGDVARAVAGACLSDDGDRAVANIGTGAETTVEHLAKLVVRLCESSSEVRHAPARPGEILRSCAVVERAAVLLGFRAATPLEAGLADTLDWVRTSQSPRR